MRSQRVFTGADHELGMSTACSALYPPSHFLSIYTGARKGACGICPRTFIGVLDLLLVQILRQRIRAIV
jgi:hypothetical protein